MELPVVQDQNVQALGKTIREAVEEVLESVTVQRLTFEKKPLSGLRLDSTVETVAPVGRPLLLDGFYAGGFYAGKCDPAPCDRHESKPALVLAEQANGPLGLGLNRLDPGWKLFLERYLLSLAFFGWLGRGAFGLASSS